MTQTILYDDFAGPAGDLVLHAPDIGSPGWGWNYGGFDQSPSFMRLDGAGKSTAIPNGSSTFGYVLYALLNGGLGPPPVVPGTVATGFDASVVFDFAAGQNGPMGLSIMGGPSGSLTFRPAVTAQYYPPNGLLQLFAGGASTSVSLFPIPALGVAHTFRLLVDDTNAYLYVNGVLRLTKALATPAYVQGIQLTLRIGDTAASLVVTQPDFVLPLGFWTDLLNTSESM